ncbi:MAG: hypothetical protein K2Y37_23320 [Pirellulales bacterium]|nr:hypothetical protein [Pirellulales bacterium]
MKRITPDRTFATRRRRLHLEQLETRDMLAATPLTLAPIDGSIGYLQSAAVSQSIAGADGVRSYTLSLAAGQRLATVATAYGAPLNVSIVSPVGQTLINNQASPGYPLALAPYYVTTAGTWTINVSAPAGSSGAFLLGVAVNGGFEYLDSSSQSPQAIDKSLTMSGSLSRYAWIGTTVGTGDIDQYTVNLTGKAGKAFDFALVGQSGANFAGQTLQLIGPDGATVVATAVPYTPQGGAAGLRISGYTVAGGIYTLRFNSTVAGTYALAVGESGVLAQTNAARALGLMVSNGWTTQSTVTGLLSTLSFDRVFQSLSTDEVLTALLRVGAVNGYSDLATLKAALPSRGVNLTDLRPDGVLGALSVATYGNLLTSTWGPQGAVQAKNLLKTAFEADRLAFVDVFSTAELVQLFDDSITTSANSARDLFMAFVTHNSGSTFANVVDVYQTWVHDSIKVNTPTPQAAVTALNALPAGSRVLHLADYAEVAGYGIGLTPGYGYLDGVDASGNPTPYYMIWMDRWLQVAQPRITNFFTQFKALGGQVDRVVMDIETVGMDYFRLRTVDHRVNPSSTPSQTIFQAIMADSRWAGVRDQLLKAGLTTTDLNSIATWATNGTQAAIWNGVMQTRVAAYLNQAIYQPIKQLYPNIPVMNYRYYLHTPTITSGNMGVLTQSPYIQGAIIGNTQAVDVYGYSQGVYTGGPDTVRFRSSIGKITFTQNTNGSGAPVASGLVRVDMGYVVNGIKAGDKVTITNANNQPFDSRYVGTFTIYSVASDFKSFTFNLQLASPTAVPANYTYNGTPLQPAIADFWTPYKAFVADVKLFRTQAAVANVPFTPWITSPSWLLQDQGVNYTYYPEMVLHAALNGAQDFVWWKATWDADLTGAATINKLLVELDGLVGYADRKTLTLTDVGFADGYTLTGMEAGGRRVYRLTPDPNQTLTVLSSTGTVSIRIGSQTVTIPNASIYSPANPASTLGYWIVQTQGSTQLVGSASQVLTLLGGVL